MRPEERNRPKILQFFKCKNIKISRISLKNGLCWIQDYRNSTNIAIDSIKVESNTFWNNDGIDLVDSKNIRLTNSFFNSDDDGICLKSSDRNSRCENIYISNCTVRSSAIKFGTASVGGFKNIYIGDINIYDTYRSAVAIECLDGGTLENVAIKNIRLTYKEDDFRPACIFDDVNKIRLNNIEIPSAKEMPVMIFNHARHLTLKQIQLPVKHEKGILKHP